MVALRYYRALSDGCGDAYVADVAARILADEERHVPFHLDRLRQGFIRTPVAGRIAVAGGWWVLMVGVVLVVALDHGRALHALGVTRWRFVADVLRLFRPMVAFVFRSTGRPAHRAQANRPDVAAVDVLPDPTVVPGLVIFDDRVRRRRDLQA